ncbi:hypothetical protein EYZ11_000638 [Aspergillus tanneri]|uniref:Alpha/beta hydrolase fold-3 domain-containing protein n=1 Tax=Aspergillus tanneri TaxID=1220188 RepID=A0A4V6RQZ4_9EURO|nr:hypothetical protein EYZ11_000638 [Aspergillus tanneri]
MSSLGISVGLLKALLLRVPLILKTALLHGSGLSPVSGKQDLRTELTVAIIRSFMGSMAPVGVQQRRTMRDPGIQGPMWVSKVTFPAPEDAVQDAVFRAIEDLKAGDETFDIPVVSSVEAEWTGHRDGVDKNAPQPGLPEEEKYQKLQKEARTDTVILYFHGGAYFLMDPCTHRAPVCQLAKRADARVLSVRYRLAPQHPFPSALVDALVAYLSLLAPPPGSFHNTVPAKKILFSGDSAGANLCLVLLQTLLTLRRTSPTIRFHGQDIPLELPAGLALTSPWCDITRSMPSIVHNALYDYLPLPQLHHDTTYLPPKIPPDSSWPCTPPRVDFFAHASALIHPLVSPLAAHQELWKDAPPIFISVGEEGLADEGLVIARKMHQAGVPVVVDQFEGMPHCFALIIMGTSAGRLFFDRVADFCRDAVAGRVKSSGHLSYITYQQRSICEIPLEDMVALTDEEVDERMRQCRNWRVEGEKQLRKQWAERARL